MEQEQEKIQFAAKCIKKPRGNNLGGRDYKVGAVYGMYSYKGAKTSHVMEYQGIIEESDFKKYFKKVTVELTPEMDKADSAHWKEVMDLAQKYGLIVQAYGGTATLITHRNQLEYYGLGEFLRIQKMNGIDPKDLPYPFNGESEAGPLGEHGA